MKAVCIRLTKSTWKTEDLDIQEFKESLVRLLLNAGYAEQDLEIRVKDIPGMGN